MVCQLQHWLQSAADLRHPCPVGPGHLFGPSAAKLASARVTRVQRIEAGGLWEQYQTKKRYFSQQAAELRGRGISVPRLTPRTLQPSLPDVELDPDANELFLFHGTSMETALTIAEQGFDHRIVSQNGLYGAGSYFADWSCKSAQYARPHPGSGVRVFLLCRVLMGMPDMIRDDMVNDSERRRPRTSQATKKPFDSIFAERGVARAGAQTHNEYVVFGSHQVYPEYLVSFTVP